MLPMSQPFQPVHKPTGFVPNLERPTATTAAVVITETGDQNPKDTPTKREPVF